MTYEYIAIAALGLSVILLGLVIWLFLRLKNNDRIRQEFFATGNAESFDQVVSRHNQSIGKLQAHLDEVGEFIHGLANANRKNFQKIGFVRFDPFGDGGGNISFAIAILDADNNGFVLSSLHGREGNRVYSKEITKGESKSQLTEEEQAAIKQAK